MKVKTPHIYSFTEMYNEYNKGQERVYISNKNGSYRHILYDESPQMKKKRIHVLELLKKHQAILNELELSMVDYNQEVVIEYPQISPVLFKSNKEGSDGEYYNARVIWPLLNNEKQELRIYLGKKSEYPNFKDPNIAAIASQKISKALEKRKKENQLFLTKDEFKKMKEK